KDDGWFFLVFPRFQGVMEGYNGTIFAYGQTGSGKSFTMQGIADPSSQKEIIPRAFESVQVGIKEILLTPNPVCCACAENARFLLKASYLDMYNGDIRDLLGADTKQKLE
ncbi:KIF17 protein, partial [Nicator chloris]|nr:KIF17 protein [Nicator chloris]